MTAHEKNRRIFGSIKSLEEDIPWSIGISNMVEYLLWDTKSVLGISKTQLIKLIVEWCDEKEIQDLSFDEKHKIVKNRLQKISQNSEAREKYERGKKGYCNPREALRRTKYFSEDYLNKEFDIFLNLSSSKYLDTLYGRYVDFNKGNKWSTHGNSEMYASSTEIREMQMDNLAYNSKSKILVANELKLGGNKNKDQILKYCYMYFELIRKSFIDSNSNFLLLFIGDEHENINLSNEMEREIKYAKTQKKLEYLLDENIITLANKLSLASLTWSELILLNESYIDDNELCEVEQKLLHGFNQTLHEKAFLQ